MKQNQENQDQEKPQTNSKLVVVVRVRGNIHLDHGMKKTFENLNLHEQNWCTIVKQTPSMHGMLLKLKDYVTWGELSNETMDELFKAKGESYKGDEEKKNKYLEFHGKKYKKFFRLNPPRKGYGRKGIKVPFKMGGALSYRGEKINDLIKRMI